MKKSIVIAGVISCMLASSLSALAWYRIPGVNCPYDEGAFYSPDIPDYADSPSIFGEAYLAAHGMEVYDPKRHEQSKIYGKHLADMLEQLKEILQLDILNSKDLSLEALLRTSSSVNTVNTSTESLNSNGLIERTRNKNLFREGNRSNYQAYSKAEQLQALADAYRQVADDCKANMADLEARSEAINEALEHSASAEGYMQAVQAASQLQAIREAEKLRFNSILNDYLALLYLEQMKEEDENRLAKIHKPKYRVADPYNITEADEIMYPELRALRENRSHFVDF